MRHSPMRVVLAGLAIAAVNPLHGQDYPNRPIRLLMPQPPAGTSDSLARAISPHLTALLGQSIVIDNRAGANGIIAGQLLVQAPADGYTLLYASSSFVNNQILHRPPPYDVLRDFTAVTQITRSPGFLAVINAQSPVRNLRELIDASKNPRTPVMYASSSMGSNQHVLGELFNARAGAGFTHVPYKGLAAALNAVLGNEVQLSFGAPTTSIAYIRAGRLRALAFSGAQRWPVLPEVPTIGETVPGFVYESSWQGIFSPAHTPAAVVARLQRDIAQVAHMPKLSELWDASGQTIVASTPQQFTQFLHGYLRETAEQFRLAKVQPQ
jgi:tripartite-type tricarboxylate transporter receptor subunit TctC